MHSLHSHSQVMVVEKSDTGKKKVDMDRTLQDDMFSQDIYLENWTQMSKLESYYTSAETGNDKTNLKSTDGIVCKDECNITDVPNTVMNIDDSGKGDSRPNDTIEEDSKSSGLSEGDRSVSPGSSDPQGAVLMPSTPKDHRKLLKEHKMASLMMYGSPSVLSPLNTPISRRASKGFKPPTFTKKTSR